MSIIRYRITPTPSNTATNTPEVSPSGTACPTNTPTNTPTINITPSTTATQTNTPTQTITPSPTPLCENNFTLTQTEGLPVNIQQGLYNRITTYTGGTFSYGFFSGSPVQFITGTAPNGNNYLVYERQVGTFYTNIGFNYAAVGTPPTVNVWRGITTTGSSIVNGALFASISGNVVLASASTVYNGAYIPPFSSSIAGRSWNFAYDAVCPTATPTITPTNTQTQTNTTTQTSTPTNTPTQTIPPPCPEQVIISSGTSSMINFEGTYNRVYTYTGGTMNYAYYQQTIPDFIIGTAPNSLNYVVYKEQSSNRFITRQFNSTTDRGWSFYTGTTSTYGSPVDGGLVIGFTGTTTNGSERYIRGGYNVSNVLLTNSFVATFPPICPSSTPTNTPTITPTNTQTQTNTTTQTSTPTNTPTQTITPTCSSFTTQYLRVRLLGCSNFDLGLFDNPDFTGNANAICDYVVSGCAYGDLGTVYCGTETIQFNDHIHTFNLSPVLQPGECVTGFTVNSVVPACPCVNVIFNQITPTPTATPTITPTQTNTGTLTNTPTTTSTPTITPSLNPVCPSQMIQTNTGTLTAEYSGTYNRDTYVYTGSSFQGGYVSPVFFIFNTGADPSDGKVYSVWSKYVSGTTWHNAVHTNGTTDRFNNFITTGGSFSMGGTRISGGIGFQQSTSNPVIDGVVFPLQGEGVNGAYISYPISCPTPTPTLSPTQTSTPTITPTPSITPSGTTANIDITNGSLDISISEVYVNAVLTSVAGGSMPNTTGNGTNLSTTQVGVYDIVIFYSSGVAGQKITLTDSDNVSTCQNTLTGGNSMTFTGVKVATYQNVLIEAADGTC